MFFPGFLVRLLKDALGCCPDCRLLVVETDLRKLYLKYEFSDMPKDNDKHEQLQKKYDDLKIKFDALQGSKITPEAEPGKKAPKIRSYRKVCNIYLYSNRIQF